jgi:hypothetical protein
MALTGIESIVQFYNVEKYDVTSEVFSKYDKFHQK